MVGMRTAKIPPLLARLPQPTRIAPRPPLVARRPPTPPEIPRIPPRRRQVPVRETHDPRDILSMVAAYAKGRRTVVLEYRKATDNQKLVIREGEPYSIRYKNTKDHGRRRYLYMLCLPHNEIHSFIVDNIVSVKGTSRRFVPRWRVEF